MELIERYVSKVATALPSGQRADVSAELRSLLEEAVQERARAAGRAPDEALAAEVLREWGHPDEVAARYLPADRYLIGPALFPTYVTVVSMVIAIAAALLIGFGLLREREWTQVMQRVFDAALWNFGLVTLIFAVIERTRRQERGRKKEFDPEKLEPVRDPDKVSLLAHEIGLYVVLVVGYILNFRLDLPYLAVTPEFAQFVPLLNAWLLGVLVLNAFVLTDGRWTAATRWAQLLLGLFGIYIAWQVYLSAPFIAPVRLVAKGAVAIGIVIAAIETAVRLVRLVRRGTETAAAAASGR